jgi:hypothetical protein
LAAAGTIESSSVDLVKAQDESLSDTMLPVGGDRFIGNGVIPTGKEDSASMSNFQ